MRIQAKQASTTIQQRGINALRKNRITSGRFQLPNRTKLLRANQQEHSDTVASINDTSHGPRLTNLLAAPEIDTDATVTQQSEQQAQPETQVGEMTNKVISLASPTDVADLFFTVLNDIKSQHEANHTSGKNQTNTRIYALQARFLDLYLTYYKDAKKDVKSAISKKVDDDLDSRCLRLTNCNTPLETFVAYTFYATSWRTKHFAKDIKSAISKGITVKDYPDWVRENGEIMDRFGSAVSEIYLLGRNVQTHESKLQQVAINGLAKILGIIRTIHDPATDKDKQALKAYLREKCKAEGFGKGDKRTTIFHLFSKWLRGSDRKQASSDAKILIYAHAEGQTEETFEPWVRRHGGLNKVKASIPRTSPKKKEKSETPEDVGSSSYKGKCLTSLDVQSAPPALHDLKIGKSYDATLIRQPNGQIDIMINE